MNNTINFTDIKCPKCNKYYLFINSINGLTCEGFLYDGKQKDYKGNMHECSFSLYPKIASRDMSIEELKILAKNKRIDNLNGFMSKDQKHFYYANLYLDPNCNLKIETNR